MEKPGFIRVKAGAPIQRYITGEWKTADRDFTAKVVEVTRHNIFRFQVGSQIWSVDYPHVEVMGADVADEPVVGDKWLEQKRREEEWERKQNRVTTVAFTLLELADIRESVAAMESHYQSLAGAERQSMEEAAALGYTEFRKDVVDKERSYTEAYKRLATIRAKVDASIRTQGG